MNKDKAKMYINEEDMVVVVLANGTELIAGPAEEGEPEIITSSYEDQR